MSTLLQQIRDALAGGAMTITELQDKTGADAKHLGKALSNLNTRREITRMGRGAQASIALKTGKSPAPNKKPTRARRAEAKRPYRRIGRRAHQCRAESERQRRPVANHVRTTFTALESLIEIEGVEASVAAAFASHKEAIELLATHG